MSCISPNCSLWHKQLSVKSGVLTLLCARLRPAGDLQRALQDSVLDDFKLLLGPSDVQLSADNTERLASACMVVNALGPKVGLAGTQLVLCANFEWAGNTQAGSAGVHPVVRRHMQTHVHNCCVQSLLVGAGPAHGLAV